MSTTALTLADLLDSSKHSADQLRATELARGDYKFIADLVQQRKAAGLTQEDVALRIGISQPSVAKFERHDSDPKLSTIRRYAHAIGALIGHSVLPDDGGMTKDKRWITVSFSVDMPADDRAHAVGTYPVSKRVDFALAA
jgi:transcriptional regulator with XRE-family HTH domain